MCLEISKKSLDNAKSKQKLIKTNSENGLVFGYKHFCRTTYAGNKGVMSSYQFGHIWDTKRGWVNSDRNDAFITEDEYCNGTINKGFHVFLSKEAALIDLQDLITDDSDIIDSNDKFFVRKVWFKPEHLVAVGKFLVLPSAVVTKLYVRFD
jgi:hypothetical protein